MGHVPAMGIRVEETMIDILLITGALLVFFGTLIMFFQTWRWHSYHWFDHE
jgi:vacuolar-type H+-ATPase subunit I/STV1